MTYCVVIERYLVTSTCPVPDANCMWMDKVNKKCKYKEELQGCDPAVLAKVVNVVVPTDQELESTKAAIKAAVIKELS